MFAGDVLSADGPVPHEKEFPDFARQLSSIGEHVLTLPGQTRVLPGHGDEFTVAAAEKRFDSWVTAGPVRWPGTARLAAPDPADPPGRTDGAPWNCRLASARMGRVQQLGFEGMPRRLYACTPTRLSTWLDCPRRYRMTYLDRPPPGKGPPWAHNSLGASVHNALAGWWRLPRGRADRARRR